MELLGTDMFPLFEQFLGLGCDPRALDICLVEWPSGVPSQLGHSKEAVSSFVDVAGELAPELGASEVDSRLVALLGSCSFVPESTDVEHPPDSFFL